MNRATLRTLSDAALWHADRLNAELNQFSRVFEIDRDDYRDHDRNDEGTYGYCSECECNVNSVRRDFGIGAYEYWGSREVHTDWRDVCPTCEGELGESLQDDEEFEPEM